jgi:hypothetical protein
VRVFVSYRRRDAAAHAGRLTDALVRRFGPRAVFQDVAAIAPGEDFDDAIDRALGSCDAVLAVIGPGWLTASGPEGAPRLHDPHDHVRRELATALRGGVQVVPVLVGGAALPAAADLPDDLRELPTRQAVALRDETWNHDVDGLLRALAGPPPRRRWWLAGVAVGVALLVAGGLVWWGTGAGDGGGSTDGTATERPIPPCDVPGAGWSAIAVDPAARGTVPPEVGGPLVFRVEDAAWIATDAGWRVVLATTVENESAEVQTLGDWHFAALVASRRSWPRVCYSADQSTLGAGRAADLVVGFDVGCRPVGALTLELNGGTAFRFTNATSDPATCAQE